MQQFHYDNWIDVEDFKEVEENLLEEVGLIKIEQIIHVVRNKERSAKAFTNNWKMVKISIGNPNKG